MVLMGKKKKKILPLVTVCLIQQQKGTRLFVSSLPCFIFPVYLQALPLFLCTHALTHFIFGLFPILSPFALIQP